MPHFAIWAVSFSAIAFVIVRPFKLPEAVWAVAGAALLVLCGLISAEDSFKGIAKGLDVYLFLFGMMMLAETAREEKVFDWLAAYATKMAKGSAGRLFLLIYLVGIAVTAFLSNDATAVVLTPAVAAATKTAGVQKPLPFLFICAFIANAASFILPVSNPANLVIYSSHLPSLLQWLSKYILPSAVSVVFTYILLRYTQRQGLKQEIRTDISLPPLSAGGKTAIAGLIFTAVVLLISSACNIELGLPTALTGMVTTAIVLIKARKTPLTVLKGISWSVLPLVAGLFVIVEALNQTGIIHQLSLLLQNTVSQSTIIATWSSGMIIAFACNLMNNLPAGLIAGQLIQANNVPESVKSAILIGVDLGPNLSVTGSLATLLWFVALRREGIEVSSWTFLKLGAVVMTVTLLLTLVAL